MKLSKQKLFTFSLLIILTLIALNISISLPSNQYVHFYDNSLQSHDNFKSSDLSLYKTNEINLTSN